MAFTDDTKMDIKDDAENPVIYRPCLFCGSLEYDLAEGEVDDDGVYQPKTCDQCGFGWDLPHKLTLH